MVKAKNNIFWLHGNSVANKAGRCIFITKASIGFMLVIMMMMMVMMMIMEVSVFM